MGIVSGDPDSKIESKLFHCEIINYYKTLKRKNLK